MTTTSKRAHPWAGETAASPHLSHPEDTFAGSPHGPWVVVDAFGGQGSGPYAAQLIAAELAVDGDPSERFAAARARLATDIGPNGGGGSAVRLTITGAVAELAWLGDCRAYRLRDNQAEQLTRDHTFVQEMIDAGHLTPEQAAVSEHANILMHGLMDGVDDEPELVRVDLHPGDRILLISDGVWRALDRMLPPIGPTPQTAVHEILAAVVRRSTDDDATAVLVEFTPDEP